MVAQTLSAKDRLIALLDELPDAALAEVVSFVEFQRYKLHRPSTEAGSRRPVPVQLRGLFAGADITPEDIAGVRAEMWGGIADRHS